MNTGRASNPFLPKLQGTYPNSALLCPNFTGKIPDSHETGNVQVSMPHSINQLAPNKKLIFIPHLSISWNFSKQKTDLWSFPLLLPFPTTPTAPYFSIVVLLLSYPLFSINKNPSFPLFLLHTFISSSSTSSSTSSSSSGTQAMASTLHLSTSFICRTEPRKPNKAEDADFPAISVRFRPYSSARRLQCKVLSAHRQKAVEAVETGAAERLHGQSRPNCGASGPGCSGRVPVFVMLPLDTVGMGGGLSRARAIGASMMALRSAGVEGVMVDVWWGVVERAGPGIYDWDAYAELVRMAEKHGLKMQMVMSFHQCGGNVGDSCNIPLPPWVTEEMHRDPDIMFTDRSGRRNPEYISLGCDALPVLRGRTPIQIYSDYMQSFKERFKDYLGNVIDEIQVGMGPCGELRYPSYPENNGTWKFPGIGEFQCYDKYMMASLRAAAIAVGNEQWGRSGPHDSGHYKQFPEETGFFRREGTWNTEYGKFFLEWYSGKLLEHGDLILAAAEGIFRGTGAKLSAKVAGIHWHYKTRSHAAELTAGYYNTRHRDGYLPIAGVLAKRGVVMNFTCMEMRDSQQPEHANCSPEQLVQQVKGAAKAAAIELAGENALERYDELAYSQVLGTSRADEGIGLSAFTYLRMNKNLFEEENWRHFVAFVKGMADGGRKVSLPRSDSESSGLYVGSVIGDEKRKDNFGSIVGV